MQNKRLIIILLTTSIILIMPFVAMQFTDEVRWTGIDFIVAGVLLISAGLMCELTLRNFQKNTHRIAICGVILMMLLLIWAELAVGIFGTVL